MIGSVNDAVPREVADLCKSLGNLNRLSIMIALARNDCSVAELETELRIRQPILSQQLAILRDAGLVATRREQKSIVYRLADRSAVRIRRVLHAALDADSAREPNSSPTILPPPRHPVEAAVFARVGTLPDR